MAAVGDDQIIFVLKHRVRKELLRTNIWIAEAANSRAEDVDSQKTRTMVIRIRDPELFPEVSETIVKRTIVHTDIVRAHSNFIQHVRTEVVGPIDHAIFQAR